MSAKIYPPCVRSPRTIQYFDAPICEQIFALSYDSQICRVITTFESTKPENRIAFRSGKKYPLTKPLPFDTFSHDTPRDLEVRTPASPTFSAHYTLPFSEYFPTL